MNLKKMFWIMLICIFVFALDSSLILTEAADATNATKESAAAEIADAETILESMKTIGLPYAYAEDILVEARRAFEQAKYAEVLRNPSSSEGKKAEARNMLRLVDWEGIDYNKAIGYAKEVGARKEKALYINDKITVEKLVETNISATTMELLKKAEDEFKADRLNEAEALLSEFRSAAEKEEAEASIISGIAKGSKNFFQRYWKHLIIIIALAGILAYGFYKAFEKRILKNKARKMNAEKESLLKLIKQTQKERYEENKISEFVYKIKIKKYEERMQEIERELPVIESKLKKKK